MEKLWRLLVKAVVERAPLFNSFNVFTTSTQAAGVCVLSIGLSGSNYHVIPTWTATSCQVWHHSLVAAPLHGLTWNNWDSSNDVWLLGWV